MNTFYKHLQPNIIKFSDVEELPEDLKCHYAINYNVWGIDYFYENYLLQESTDGVYMILNENGYNFLLEDSLSGQKVLDIPRLYIMITDNFLNDDSKFQEFVMKAAKDHEVYGLGIDGFRPGKDYYINTTLFKYLSNLVDDQQQPGNSDEQEESDPDNGTVFGLPDEGTNEENQGSGEENQENESSGETTLEKVEPTFEFSTDEAEIEIDSESNVFPNLLTSTGVNNVKYYSSDINVARIDTQTGQIFIVGPGETIILAIFEGNDRYYASQADYTLTVKEKEVIPYQTLSTEHQLPNYLDENANITKYFVDLSDEVFKDYTNLDYFNKKNQLLTNTYSEDELNRFYQSICQIIINLSTIQNNQEIYYKQKNQLYDKVLNYFANSQVDDASIALNLILGSQYNIVTIGDTQLNCGCSTGKGTSTFTDSCAILYTQAMPLYLKQMFGDIEFYEDWFNIYLSESEIIPNDVLLETLELFIKEFISLDYNLDMTKSTLQYQCDCRDINSLNNSSLEYKKLNNFLQILSWVSNSLLDENTNKIKVYGEAFGELLPKLQF